MPHIPFSKQTGDMELAKKINLGHIINELKCNGPQSRAELSRKVGLSRSTCSFLVEELLQRDLIREGGKADSSGGRKPVLVDLNYDAGKAIGIKIMAGSITGALVDLSGRALKIREKTLTDGALFEDYIAEIIEIVKLLSGDLNEENETDNVIGIGIGMGGRIDYQKGILIESSILPWKNKAIAEIISEKTGLPVYLENDVNTFTLGEKHFGVGKTYSNYVCITIGQGIGAGMIVDGVLYKGGHHGAGEFGHIKIVHHETSRICSCGEHGCLEAYSSTPAMLDTAEKEFGRKVGLNELMEMAEKGNSQAKKIFSDAGYFLGLGLSNIINFFDPEIIFIGGEGTVYADYISETVNKAVQENCVYHIDELIPITYLPYESDLWVRGLATMVMIERLEILL